VSWVTVSQGQPDLSCHFTCAAGDALWPGTRWRAFSLGPRERAGTRGTALRPRPSAQWFLLRFPRAGRRVVQPAKPLLCPCPLGGPSARLPLSH
jgi:hypothetical protein